LQLAVSKDKVCGEKFLSHNCFPGPQDKRNATLSRICIGFSILVFDKEILKAMMKMDLKLLLA
jgi:hypothetical protein